MPDNDIDLEPDELGRDFGVALGATLRPAVLDGDVATPRPTQNRAVAAGKPRPMGSSSKAWPRPGSRSSTASPVAARVQQAATPLRRRRVRPAIPPSDGDCHAPLTCEGAYTNNTTPPACRLYVQGAQDSAAVHSRPWPGARSRLRTSQLSVRDHVSSVLPRMSALMAAMVAPDEAFRT